MQQQSKELRQNDNPRPQTVIKQPEGGRNQNNGSTEQSTDMESQLDADVAKKSNKAPLIYSQD